MKRMFRNIILRLKGIFKSCREKIIPPYMTCPYAGDKDICNDCECQICSLNPYNKDVNE